MTSARTYLPSKSLSSRSASSRSQPAPTVQPKGSGPRSMPTLAAVLIVMATWFLWTLANLPPLRGPNSEAATGRVLAALAILIVWPESLFDPGFQMSFAAAVALVSAYEWLRGRAQERGAVDSLVGASVPHCVRIEGHGNVSADAGQFAALARILRMGEQPFSLPLVRDLCGFREERLEITVGGDQITRALLADAGDPFDVVD